MLGMFKIIRGVDECNIETRRLSAGIPDVANRTALALIRPKFQESKSIDSVCDGCWTRQEIDADLVEKVQNLISSYNYNIVNELVEVKTRVVNGVMYKIAVNASNDRNEVKKMYIVAHESAHNDEINILSVQH